MATVRKAPGDPWRQPSRGDEVVFLPGVHGPFSMSGIPDVTLRGGEGVIIEGRVGGSSALVRINDGAHRLKMLGKFIVRGSPGRGIWITVADDIVLADIESHGHNIEGILLGHCPRAQITDIYCHDNDGDDRSHGLYTSGRASGSVITRLRCERVTGSGLQINGHGMGAKVEHVVVEEMDLDRCGSEFTPSVSLMSVSDSRFRKFRVRNSPPGWWAVLFSDGGGREFACFNNRFEEYSASPAGPPRGVHEEDGSSGNSYEPGAGWAPGAPPVEPPVEPPGEGVDVTRLRADFEDILSELEAQANGLSKQAQELAEAEERLAAAGQDNREALDRNATAQAAAKDGLAALPAVA